MVPQLRAFAAPLGDFDPAVRSAVRVEMSAIILVTAFSAFTQSFTGLILRRDLGATPFQFSVMASAGSAAMLLALVWARAIRGRTPLPYVVWPALVGRALFLFIPFIHSSWAFVALLATTSCLLTATGPAQAALIERVYPRDQRGRALGMIRTVAAVAAIPLGLVAGRVLEITDYRWVFFAAGLIGVAGGLRLLKLPVPAPSAAADPTAPPTSHFKDAWSALRNDRPFRALVITSFIFGLGAWIQEPANPLLLADILRVTTSQIAWMAAPGAIVALFAYACWGRLVDRRSSLDTLRFVWICGALSPCIAYLATTPWFLSLNGVTNAFFGSGLEIVAIMAIIDLAGPRRAAQYVAIATTFTGLRGVLGPPLGALIIDVAGVRAVYLVAACIMFFAVWLLHRQVRALSAIPVSSYHPVPSSPLS